MISELYYNPHQLHELNCQISSRLVTTLYALSVNDNWFYYIHVGGLKNCMQYKKINL